MFCNPLAICVDIKMFFAMEHCLNQSLFKPPSMPANRSQMQHPGNLYQVKEAVVPAC